MNMFAPLIAAALFSRSLAGPALTEASAVNLMPSGKRTEFRLYIAWKRSDALATSVVCAFNSGGKVCRFQFDREPSQQDVDELGKQMGWVGHVACPKAKDMRRVRGINLPRDEDFVRVAPFASQSALRAFLSSVRCAVPASVARAVPSVPAIFRKPMTLPDLIRRVRACVVVVHAGNNVGTGFIVGSHLYTCAHVIEGSWEVTYSNGYGVSGEATRVVSFDRFRDVAVFDSVRSPALIVFGDSGTTDVGDQVAVVGNPVGLEDTVTTGIVSATRSVNGIDMLQLSAGVGPGSSGSPVFDMYGNVVGMVSARLASEPQYGFALARSEFELWRLPSGVSLADISHS